VGLVTLLTLACSVPPAQRPADLPEQAPEFTLADIEGANHSLADTAGRVRLIDFWATWCPPCREEIPMLVDLDRRYRDQGLTVLGISDEAATVLREFVEREGVSYTNLIDDGAVAERYLVPGLPTAYLVDRDGRIVERYIGAKPERIVEARIRELLALPPPA
jgi:peroxiredoxin